MAFSPKNELADWLTLAADPNIRRYIQASLLKQIFTGTNEAARLKAIELYESFSVGAADGDLLANLTTEQLIESDKLLVAWIEKRTGAEDATD